MGRLEPDASTMPRRSKRRDRLVAMGILVLVVVVPVLVIFVGPVTLKAYDAPPPHRGDLRGALGPNGRRVVTIGQRRGVLE